MSTIEQYTNKDSCSTKYITEKAINNPQQEDTDRNSIKHGIHKSPEC